MREYAGTHYRSNYILEERHTDQLDYNFAASIQHEMRHNMRIMGGVNLRVNRTWYYDEIKDLLGGDYWYDIDKFAERDMSSATAAQNDLDYYWATGHARIAREGDKFSYNYRAHLLEGNAWALYSWRKGGGSRWPLPVSWAIRRCTARVCGARASSPTIRRATRRSSST